MYREIETKLKNAVFEARTDKSGNVISYRISPEKGYKLHEITLDEFVEETGKTILGFTVSYITAGANYNFEKNPRQIYAVKKGDDT